MDISTLLTSHADYVNWISTAGVGGMAVGILLVVSAILGIGHSQGGIGLGTTMTAMVIGMGGMIVGVSILGSMIEDHEQVTATRIATDIRETYDAQVPEEIIVEAIDADDHDVISGTGKHEDKKKSLGININESDGTVTLYQGNEELLPVH